MNPRLTALVALAAAALATPAHASGISCTTTLLDVDCNPLPDDTPIDTSTLFEVICEATAAGEDGPTANEFEPTVDELRILADDPDLDGAAGLMAVDACGSAVFALDACLPPGTYTIAHTDGAGWPELDAQAPCADGDGGGCQQAPGSGAPWPLLILFAGLIGLNRRADTPVDRP